MERNCPNCDIKLKDCDYNFCTSCAYELPQELVKKVEVSYINTKLKFELIPDIQFLFFKIPFENKNSVTILKFILGITVLIAIMIFAFSLNMNYNK